MSPICKFLVDRIRQFQDGELDLAEAIPIRICDRPGCGRFKLPKRQTDKCFCSGTCRSADYQSNRPPKSKRDYMREYRKTIAKMSKIKPRRSNRVTSKQEHSKRSKRT